MPPTDPNKTSRKALGLAKKYTDEKVAALISANEAYINEKLEELKKYADNVIILPEPEPAPEIPMQEIADFVLSQMPKPKKKKGKKGKKGVDMEEVNALISHALMEVQNQYDKTGDTIVIQEAPQKIVERIKEVTKLKEKDVDYKEIHEYIDGQMITYRESIRPFGGVSSLRALTDVDISGLSQDEQGNYILSDHRWGSIIGDIADQTDLQDEFVNVTGDTMTGALILADQADALTSGDYPVQVSSGNTFSNSTDVGHIITTDNYLSHADQRIFQVYDKDILHMEMDWWGTLLLTPFAGGVGLDITKANGNADANGINIDLTTSRSNSVNKAINISMNDEGLGPAFQDHYGIYMDLLSDSAVVDNIGLYMNIIGVGGSSRGIVITGDPEQFIVISASNTGNPTTQLFQMTANNMSGNRPSSMISMSSTHQNFNGTLFRGALTGTGGTINGEFLIFEDSTGEIVNWQPTGNLQFLADNIGISLGVDSDATILYDGTDLIIDPDVVGSGKVQINGDLGISGTTTGLNQSVTNRALASWNANGGLRNNSNTWLGSNGQLWLTMPDDSTWGLVVDTQLSGGFGGKAYGINIIAKHTGGFSNPIGIQTDMLGTQSITHWKAVGGGSLIIADDFSLTPSGVNFGDVNANSGTVFIQANSTNSAVGASFLDFENADKKVFNLDDGGNMLVEGAYINLRGTIGRARNLATYSEQQDNAGWVNTGGGTITADNVDAPDGTPNKADTFTWDGVGLDDWKKTITGSACANSTYTLAGWFRRSDATAFTVRMVLTDSTESDISEIRHIGLSANQGKWQYLTLTHTFGSGATGDLVVKVYNNTGALAVMDMYGLHIVEGSGKVGYVPTQNYQQAETRGTVTNGNLLVCSGDEPVTHTIRAGDLQSTTNLFEVKDNTDTVQTKIDSDFALHTAGRYKKTTRTTTTYQILITDSVIFSNTDSGAYTDTLPVGVEEQTLKIINSGTSGNNLTVSPNGSELLLGANSGFTLLDGETLVLTYNSTDGWY